MSRESFNHTSRTEAAMTVALDRPCGRTVVAGGAWIVSPVLVGSRI
jgi:hypothetical protein